MSVTSTTQTGYTQATNTANNTKKKEGDIDPNKGQNLTLKTLDKEGNELLNQVLEGKTDKEKWFIKLKIDLNLSIEIKNGRLAHITNTDNSKSNVISKLEAYVTMQRKFGNPDMTGTIAAAEKFLEAYKKNDSTKDVKNQENSVVDKFLEDLYSKGSTVTASAIIKETIQNKVNEYAQVLMDSKGDAPKSESEISKMLIDYKKELLEDYKKSLDGASNDNMTIEQEAIIKLLLDENTLKASSLEKLLTTIEVNKTQSVSVTGTTSANESKADASEYDFWKDPQKGLSFLDDKANKLLNNLLSGKSNEEIFLTKVTMMINISHPITVDKEGNVIRGNNSNFDISSQAVWIRLENYNDHLKNAFKGGGLDTLNLVGITEQLLQLYTQKA